MKKKILSLVMAMVLCFSFTVFYGNAYDKSFDSGSCFHNSGLWTLVDTHIGCDYENDNTHSRVETYYYYCSYCDESFYLRYWYDGQPHSFGDRVWTGEHNHSGNTHSYTYESSCACGATQTEVVVLPCAGNGSCYLPYSNPIESEIE